MNSIQKIETSTLRIIAVVNLLMAFAGWYTYDVTASEAMLLDGNFSFIAVLVTIAAEFISRSKHQRTATFPFGKYSYEAFFVLFKGFLILGIILGATFQNTIKILDYITGEEISIIKTGPIVYYIIGMVILCFGMAFFAKKQNIKMNNQSDILRVEVASLKLDGYLSLFSGAALVAFSFINEGSFFGFLRYTGDAIIVLLMCVMMIKSPLNIIKDAFVELGGGVLQDKNLRNDIEDAVLKIVEEEFSEVSVFVSKTGSNYLVLVYLDDETEKVSIHKVKQLKKEISTTLSGQLDSLSLEFVI
ncbi:cation transporter [Flammeovirga pacifica]|nr:cation transporter [Flammeovirga pacifica]